MNVKSITLEGFKSIYKKTTITFPDNGLWKISGDVGVGKTTLGECILFGLFGSVKDKNNKDLISWGAKKCTVTIDIVSRGNNISIHRVIRAKGQGVLDIYINGELLDYTNKRDGQQILEEDYYDVSRVAVESLCIISLNNFKSIVRRDASSNETKKFIDNIFGFDIINKYIEKTKEHLSEVKEQCTINQATIDTYKNQRQKYISERDNILNNTSQEEIEGTRRSLKEKMSLRDEITSTHKDKLTNLNQQLSAIEKRCNTIKNKGSQLKSTISKLSSGKCPLCGAPVKDGDLTNHKEMLELCREQWQESNNLRSEKSDEIQKEITDYNNTLSEVNKEIESLNKRLIHLRESNRLITNNYNNLIMGIDEDIDKAKSEGLLLEQNRNQWQELYDKLFYDARPSLLHHYIPTLNKNINFYMQELQQPYIISFDETFRCSICAFGMDNIPANSLSVGQSKLLDTSIILGILKTLLGGVNFNIIFLDELLSNMHAGLRDVVCKMLRNNLNNKLIYVITHADIDDSLFDGKLKVKMHHWEDDNNKLIQNTEYIEINMGEGRM